MRLAALLVFFGLVGLGVATVAQPDLESQCAAAFQTVEADYLERRYQGPEARADLLRRLRRFRDRHPEAPLCRLTTRDVEAVVLLLEGRIGAADSLLLSTFGDPFFDRLPASRQSRLYYNKGYVNDQIGRLGDAAVYYYRAASLGDRMPAHQATRAYIAAASVARDLGDPAVEVYLDSAARILRDSTMAETDARENRASLWIERTRLATEQAGEAAKASTRDTLYQRALTYADSAYAAVEDATTDGEAGRAAHALIYRSNAERGLKRYAAAVQSLELASPLLARGASVFGTLELTWWGAQAQTFLEAGRLDDALRASRRAEQAAMDLNQETAVAAWLAQTRTRTGRIYERLGRPDAAAIAYREAIALAQVERDRIGLRDWTASSFASQQRPHRALARLLVRTNRPWEAFATLDATRARVYRDLRASSGALRRLAPERRRVVEALADSLASVRVALATATDAASRSALTSTTALLQDSIQAGLDGISPPPQPLNRTALQATLATDDRVLLTYLLTSDDAVAFVVRADTFTAVPLPAARDSVRAWGAQLTTGWTRSTPDPSFEIALAEKLYAALLAPVEALLPGDAPLTIVPDPALAQIPFAALVRPGAAEPDYLVRRHPITTELAVGLMLDRPEAAEAPTLDLLALGRSTFEGQSEDLPFVPAEIRSVSAHADRVQSGLDASATEQLFSRMAPRARIIHIASHAYVDAEIPLNSHILLSKAEGDDDDGTLFLHELQNQALDADLVVLSGCSTAQGRQQDGEGLVGLQYGVRIAGARAALATLWPVDDRATVQLMDAFYRALAEGETKDRALQIAQVAFLDASEAHRSSPFFWAGAVLSGNPAPVAMRSATAPWGLGLGLAALLAALGLAWRLRSQIRPHA